MWCPYTMSQQQWLIKNTELRSVRSITHLAHWKTLLFISKFILWPGDSPGTTKTHLNSGANLQRKLLTLLCVCGDCYMGTQQQMELGQWTSLAPSADASGSWGLHPIIHLACDHSPTYIFTLWVSLGVYLNTHTLVCFSLYPHSRIAIINGCQ